jgi:hypothetical protein
MRRHVETNWKRVPKEQLKTYRSRLRYQAVAALLDLALVAEMEPEDQLQQIFTPDTVEILIQALIADHFLVGTFYRRFFDPTGVDNSGYIKGYFESIFSSFEDTYKSTVHKIDSHVSKKLKQAKYNHPYYFKSEVGYTELVGLFDESAVIPVGSGA